MLSDKEYNTQCKTATNSQTEQNLRFPTPRWGLEISGNYNSCQDDRELFSKPQRKWVLRWVESMVVITCQVLPLLRSCSPLNYIPNLQQFLSLELAIPWEGKQKLALEGSPKGIHISQLFQYPLDCGKQLNERIFATADWMSWVQACSQPGERRLINLNVPSSDPT